ncbi:peptide synthetase [Zafaria cholistanensis]|uniref:Peptide synthetase n=1 Tax=Zafaria cholistanensis TaxID=1682741 RepID=A0A5A7NTH3_9MICC|nr:Pls/PosA family non-ribosomal peptide synthetase [Zafaria cholistanensis]GER24155.1 peptide synthetase [Zafaria cholistanensis]
MSAPAERRGQHRSATWTATPGTGSKGGGRHRLAQPLDALRVPAGVLLAGTPAGVRWRPGQRLEGLFEDRCDALAAAGHADRLAVDGREMSLTYAQLDARANQLARYLIARGVRPGDRLALLFDQPVRSYVALLAVLKARAAFVPLDVGFPEDRLAYIIGDAGVGFVLTLSAQRERVERTGAVVVCLDEEDALVAGQEAGRLESGELGEPAGDLAYIIYTSGSTGRPKGVAVEHPSICNFVQVAAETYGYVPEDRVYQGMTIAFDFSMEEIWVPWMVGATLVPKPGGTSLLGMELGQFIRERGITAMCCVPTLLATLDEDLPQLRFLLVSGEACPRDLVARWHRPGRRFLNVYGPTEATVTATWDEVHPDKPVTLGTPLPTYTAVILDPDAPRALAPGETGEIGVAGIGLARGYVNRDDLTARAFIPDFLGIPDNPSGRIYRTGDLGRFTAEGTIEYLGRIDTQVKIRGYRIELTEIESVLLQHPGIAQAVVDTYTPAPGAVELVAYYSLRHGVSEVDVRELQERLRERLPAYMVPAYLEQLDKIPMLPSDKADRKNLPAPTRARITGGDGGEFTTAATPTEELLARCLGSVLGVEKVSTTAHFFNDLGANSLLMANFSAGLRKSGFTFPPAMRDIYQNPDIRRLAAVLDQRAGEESAEQVEAAAEPVYKAPTAQYVLCGALQLLIAAAYGYAMVSIVIAAFFWIIDDPYPVTVIQKSIVFGVGAFLVFSILPILLKWILVGRWKEQEFPIWGLAYIRFWFVKNLVNLNPLRMFVGTPVYSLYLRALGAKIGKGVTIFSAVPVCTDLLTVGNWTIAEKDAFFSCYRARGGRIQTGPVTLGSNVLIRERTFLDIHTSMGDDAQLGHASALHRGQSVPAGQSWHGSPAQPATANYRTVEPVAEGAMRRRVLYSLWTVFTRFAIVLPLGMSAVALTLPPFLATGLLTATRWPLYLELLGISVAVFFPGIMAGLLAVALIPRLLNLFLAPGQVYPLFGIRFVVQRWIQGLTNNRFFMQVSGDSSLVVHYLRLLGYHQPGLVQTGSNFGTGLAQDNPLLSTVGSGTMVSDGLSIINTDYSSTSFRAAHVSIGARSYYGNEIAYPPGGRTGDNCLFGTKVMVPIDGPLRENTGLLGSPPFEIPRSVERDSTFDEMKTEEELRERLPLKNRHNGVTLALFFLVRWFNFYVALVVGALTLGLLFQFGAFAVMASAVFLLFYRIAVSAFVEHASQGFRRLVPLFCSIYQEPFWRHERFWKLSAPDGVEQLFNGTPFKPLLLRLLGVRVGKQLFDDGVVIPEKTLVTIGDYCTINAQSCIQCHSMEDGAFKLDGTTIGNECTLGTGSFVHYSVAMGDGAVLETDSFLMKGEEVPANVLYGGNPARQIADRSGRRQVGAAPK